MKCAVLKCEREASVKIIEPSKLDSVQLSFKVCKEHAEKIVKKRKDGKKEEIYTIEEQRDLYKKALELACTTLFDDEVLCKNGHKAHTSCEAWMNDTENCFRCWQDHLINKAKEEG